MRTERTQTNIRNARTKNGDQAETDRQTDRCKETNRQRTEKQKARQYSGTSKRTAAAHSLTEQRNKTKPKDENGGKKKVKEYKEWKKKTEREERGKETMI